MMRNNLSLRLQLYEAKFCKCYVQLLVIFFIIFSFGFKNSFANFGDSCVPIPNSSISDDYLRTRTAYGYLAANIDMTTYIADACDVSKQDFTFCIASNNSMNVCDVVSMQLGQVTTLGAISTDNSLGGNKLLKDIILSVEQVSSNLMCLMMPTSRGKAAIACRSTIAKNDDYSTNNNLDTCTMVDKSCYAGNKSQSVFNVSGVTVECVSNTLNNVFFRGNKCNKVNMSSLASFASFRSALVVSIRAALVIYVILYGFNLVMNHQYANLDKVAMFILKFLFISYFAVGLGPVIFQDGKPSSSNGMVDIGLPFLSHAISDFANMVYSSGGSKGLCQFDTKSYPKNYGYYALWDSIDCRIGYYLGMQILYNTANVLRNASSSTPESDYSGVPISMTRQDVKMPSLSKPDNLSFFTVLYGFLMSGEVILVICGVAFSMIFGAIMLNFINSYLVCLITLYVMAYISPIFITMALFERTKDYFDAWLKITISCTLQPAVLAGFVVLLLTLYDSSIYGNCRFQKHDYSLGEHHFSTFELQLPYSNQQECIDSFGYKLLAAYNGYGWKNKVFLIFSYITLPDVVGFVVNMLYIMALSFIFYHLSTAFNDFAAGITDGPSVEGVVVSVQKSFDKFAQAASKLKDAIFAKDKKQNKSGVKKPRSNVVTRSDTPKEAASDQVSS